MTSSEWKNFLSENLHISKSQARAIYHVILSEVKYFNWLSAFQCRMANKHFDYDAPKGKCITCKLKKYCFGIDKCADL